MDTRTEGRGGARAGLVSLGLIMQLVGSVMAAYLIACALLPLVKYLLLDGPFPHFGDFYPDYYQWDRPRGLPSPPTWHLTLVAGVGIVRAILHRFAGGAILYRHRGAFAALCVYLAIAFLHTALCLFFLPRDFTGEIYQWSIVVLVAAAWPVCLLVAASRSSFRRALRGGPAASDETAPDEVATLSIFMGLVGAMVALFVVYAAIESYGSNDAINRSTVGSTAVIIVCALLLVRALWQLVTGFRVAGRPVDGAESLATRGYVRMALIASALAGLALVVHLDGSLERSHYDYSWSGNSSPRYQVSRYSFTWSALAIHGLVAYLLLLWPLLLRRFLTARKDAAPSGDGSHRAGASLAALGWFLLAVAAIQLAVAIVALVAGSWGTSLVWNWAQQFLDGPIQDAARSPWLQILVAVPQVWVALELLGGTRRRMTAATAFAVVATLASMYSIWGDLQYIMRLIGIGLGYPTILLAYFQAAFPLLVPIVTLVFVQHHLRKAGPVQTVTEP